jgi:molybdenum-dependent DNA-binding transcriptional regulator ModE
MNLKQNIIRIINEEVDKKTQTLLNYIQKFGLIKGSKLVGSYKNLKEILKGTNDLTRDVMVKTIIDVCKEKGGFSMQELGLEEIKLDEGKTLLRNLSYIDKNGIEVVTYEKDDDGNYDEEPSDWLSFNYDSKFSKGGYVLDTIHLYEILDAVMEIENKNQ